MKIISKILILVMFVFLVFFYNCSKEEKRSGKKGLAYTVKKVGKGPVIDGILTDKCWNNIDAVTLVLCKTGKKSELPTNVRMLWDDEYLYIGFECQDNDAASTVFQQDGPIMAEDYCSFYFNASGDTLTYSIFAVAPTGVVFDAFAINGKDDIKTKILSCWNCENARVSVSVYGAGAIPGNEDRFWTAEIAIPFQECMPAKNLPPIPGDVWKFNLFRHDVTNGETYLAFNPTGSNNFDKPSSFAWLKFGN